jgi:hypothetical protein
MAAYWNLLSMKFDENEDYEINWKLKNQWTLIKKLVWG